MSSGDGITCSKGTLEGFSLPYDVHPRRGTGKKPANKQNPQEKAQQSTSGPQETGQVQQEAVIQISPLPHQLTRPTSSQSIAGTLAGERPFSRETSVMGKAGGQPQSPPPQLGLRHPQHAPTCTVPPSPARTGTPQVPSQTISQDSGSHLSQMSALLFTEDRYSTSIDGDQEICDAEVNNITRQRTPLQATIVVMSPKRPVSTPSTVDYLTQGNPNQVAPQQIMQISKAILPQ